MILFTRIHLFLLFIALSLSGFAQTAGDFRSKASGNWGDITTWQVFDGAIWNDAIAGEIPGGTNESDADNVYIEAGHTVTLETDHSCKDLHLNTTADVVRINTQNNSLNSWGKMSFYTGTAPGTTGTIISPITSSGVLGWITTGASGFIRFRGTVNRVVMVQGEVNSNNTNSGWNLDFAFDPSVVGEINDRIRTGTITVTSGELFVNNNLAELRVGTNSTGDVTVNGSFLLKSGATVRGGAGIFKNGTTAAQSITVESGATLVITRSTYILAAATLDLSGTVILQNAINFPTNGARTSAATVNSFNNLTLEGTGAKTLQTNTTVNGTLTMGGTASLSLGAFALSYGASGELAYAGTAVQTTASAEFPTSSGPNKLIINNSNGVTLHADRTINGQLTLTAGLFDLSTFNLTLGASSPTIAGTPSASNMIVTSGTGELRKIFSAPGTFFYPIGETTGTAEYTYAQITINSASVLDATTYFGVRVKDAEHPADAGVAFDNISRYWGLSSNMTTPNYNGTFQYLIGDVINDEASINSYLYADETALAAGSPITNVNSTFHRIIVSGLTSTGFVTGSNLCDISNNTIVTPTITEFCNSASALALFDGSVASVSSGTPTYQWQLSTNGGAWGDIALNGQSEDYTEPATLNAGTYAYRRKVSDLVNCLGSNFNLSNEITIVVNSPITGNSIGANESVFSGGDPIAFTETASLAEGNGTYTYQWKSSFVAGGPYSSISLATNNVYDAPSGIAQTTYFVREVTSGGCISTSNEITVTVTPLGIQGPAYFAGIHIYPNPTTKELFVDLDLSSYKEVVFSIQSITGESLYQEHLNPMSELTLDLSGYSSGIYYAHLVLDGKKTVSYKIIKE